MVGGGRPHRVTGAEARQRREFRRTCVAEAIDVAYRDIDVRVVGAEGAALDGPTCYGEIVHAEGGIGQINMRGTNRMIWFSLPVEMTPGVGFLGDYVGFDLVAVPDERYPSGVIHVAVHLRVAAEPAYFERGSASTLAARKL